MPTERTVLVRLKGESSDLNRAILSSAAAVNALRKEIDTTNDRTAWLAQGFLALAPASVPIGAAMVPAVAGLAAQLGLAAGAVGTLALGFNGIGDSFKALNDYQLEPTAENLAKVREEFQKIGPDGAQFVQFLDEVGPKFTQLQMAARAGMFPGMTEGLEDIVDMLPRLREVVTGFAEGIGQLSADAGEGLSGPRFEEFFDYLASDAQPLLVEMGRTIGNFVDGLAAMMVAFSPLTNQFSGGFLAMSRSFADWAHSLDENDSFQSFLAYVQESVPLVLNLFGSLVNAFVSLAQAAAPVGEFMIPRLKELLDIIAILANTPLGTAFIAAAAAMSIYGRAVALASITTGGLLGKVGGLAVGSVKGAVGVRTLAADVGILGRNSITAGAATERMAAQSAGAAGRLRATGAAIGKAGAAVAGLALMSTGAADKIGLTNTASLALMGTLAGPLGAAMGGAVGATMDLVAAQEALATAADNARLAAESGDLGRMREAQSRLSAEYDKQGDSLFGLNRGFGQLARGMEGWLGKSDEAQEASRALEVAIQAEKGQLRQLGGVFPTVAREARGFSLAAERQAVALRESRQAAGETARSFLNIGDAAEKGKKSLNAFLKAMEQQAEDLRNFRINAQKAGELGVRKGLINHLIALGPTGARAMAQLANATQTQVARANAAHRLHQREIQKTKDGLGGLKSPPPIDIKVDTAAAINGIGSVAGKIAALDRDITITTHYQSTGSPPGSKSFRPGLADGGRLPGDGGPYGDRVPILAAPTEFMVSNRYGQVDRNLELLRAINDNRYADGGQIAAMARASQSISVAAPSVSVGGPAVRVFIDGREVRAVVQTEIADRDDMKQARGRASYAHS